MLKLSPTKTLSYLSCPFKYKCDCDWEIRQRYHKDSPDLIFGNLIHECMDDFYKNIKKEERDFNSLRFLFEKKFKENWAKHKEIFGSKRNIVYYVELAKMVFQNFIESEFFNSEPLSTEEYPKFQLTPDLEIGGKFDRIDCKEKKITLIDYKTGKLRRNGTVDEFQLNFYELLLSKVKPDYVVKEKIYYYMKENEILRFEASKDKITQTEKKIIKIAERITNDKEMAPIPNSTCVFCNYRPICPIINNSSKQSEWKKI